MKKTLLVFVVLFMTMTSFAQGINTVDKKGLNYIVASYSPLSFTGYDNSSFSSSSMHFNAINLRYTRAQALAKFPLYIDFGVQFSYLFSEKVVSDRIEGYTLTVPVNIAYRMSFKEGKMHLTPYTGPYFKFNLAGKYGNADLTFGSNACRRFQFGWQGGVAFSVKAFYITAAYNYDLSKVVDVSNYNRFHGFTFGLGVVF